MRQAPRTDANQQGIVKALRQIPGVSVCIIAGMGKGCPDIMVGFKQRTYLYEIKDGDGQLTTDEKTWHKGWYGHVAIARDVMGILRDMGIG